MPDPDPQPQPGNDDDDGGGCNTSRGNAGVLLIGLAIVLGRRFRRR